MFGSWKRVTGCCASYSRGPRIDYRAELSCLNYLMAIQLVACCRPTNTDWTVYVKLSQKFTPLQHNGNCTHQKALMLKKLYILPTRKLYEFLYGSPNRQQLFIYTGLRVLFDIWYNLICLLTAIGLSPGGSSTVHIYTQTIHRTIQNKQYIEQHNNFGRERALPRLG